MTIVNLTPHAITIPNCTPNITGGPPATWTLAPSGRIARALERVTSADPIDGIPTTTTVYTGVVDLPDPQPDAWYVVSALTAQVAHQIGRPCSDLLVPGEQVRDAQGRIAGCRSLGRWRPSDILPTYFTWGQYELFAGTVLARGGSGDVSAEYDLSPATSDLSEAGRSLGRYARNYASAGHTASGPRPGATVTFYCTTRTGLGVVRLVGVPFGTVEERDAAYQALAQAGCQCNDMIETERRQAERALTEPSPGYVERLVERARREGVLPATGVDSQP